MPLLQTARSSVPLVRTVVLLLVAAAVLASCGDDRAAATDPGAVRRVAAFRCPATAGAGGAAVPLRGRKLRVVTTVAPITSIVANVAGDRAAVQGLIPEGQDSHTFEPKPSAARLLADADLVLVNGLDLEDPTKELARRRGARIVELGTAALRPDQYLYDFSFPESGGTPNPHLWTNPPMGRCYATVAARALAAADPANAATYRANAAALAAKVDALDAAMRTATAAMPARSRALLTYHDAYAYFAAHYGWRVIGAIQVSSFQDPSPKEVARLIDQVRDQRVRAIFGSEVFPSSVLAQIGREAGVRYVDELRDDDLPGQPGDGAHSYLGLLRFDFATMVGNLGGDPSALARLDVGDVVPDRAGYPQ
ncbi:MAG: Zinc transporter substrate-binding protein [Actinomycetia bacterium]|nr:Zinc transporter substrate-binding protein [Actinomycetes bacterium]